MPLASRALTDEGPNTASELTAEAILRLGLHDRTQGPAHLRRGLRARCQDLGMPTEGSAAELRQRLAEALGRKLPAGHTRWAKPTKPAAKSRRLEPRRRQNTPAGRVAKLAHREARQRKKERRKHAGKVQEWHQSDTGQAALYACD
jgi:hypothetical protein